MGYLFKMHQLDKILCKKVEFVAVTNVFNWSNDIWNEGIYEAKKKNNNKNMINAFFLKFKIVGGGSGSEVPKTSILSLILYIYLN